ncbi:hypothetical protein X975_20189, partial [Stegodyphus mimosarum]
MQILTSINKMSSLRLAAITTDNHLLPWPQTVFTAPYLLISTWTATLLTVILMITFFAQITAVVIMTDPSINIRELLWSDEIVDSSEHISQTP